MKLTIIVAQTCLAEVKTYVLTDNLGETRTCDNIEKVEIGCKCLK